MKRAMKVSAFVAMGILVASSNAKAQTAPTSTSGGKAVVGVQTHTDVTSSKFTEYRSVPKGVYVPFLNLFANSSSLNFSLYGSNVSQSDQRYFGGLKAGGMALKYDYNQIPHNMGNDGHAIFAETSPGVWTASQTLRQTLQTANDTKLPTSARTYDFYATLFAPTLASTNRVDVSGVRKTTSMELNFGQHLPFDVTLAYKNELKTGYRGLGGGNFRASTSAVYEVALPLDELTHDLALRLGYKFNAGNLYASFSRNIYDNRAETLTIDNMLQAVDAVQTPAAGATPALGNAARERFVMAPDNAANTGTAGFVFKIPLQTRISGSVALSTRTQDAPFYAYALNTAVFTPAGKPANAVATLPQASYGGKVNTTLINLALSTRPLEGLYLRAQYRKYDLTDNSNKFVSTGDMSQAQSQWNVLTPTVEDPYGQGTANAYDYKTERFTGTASYNFGPLTIEGQFRSGQLERTNREALSGKETGTGVTALFHANEWLAFRGTYDLAKRTAVGETVYGYQMDEADYNTTRTGLQLDLTPASGLDLSFAYFRRDVDYNKDNIRPNRTVVVSGAPKPGIVPFADTPSGLLSAKYDSWTGELNYSPNARLELGVYYTYENDLNTNQWSTTSGDTLANKLTYANGDQGDTFGANATFHFVPEKRTFLLNASSQKINGLADITARESGSFYKPGRTTLIPAGQGGAADITDWDDTQITTLVAQFNNELGRDWMLTVGYRYDKYEMNDAYKANSNLMPVSLVFLMKPNDGSYNASTVYFQLAHSF